MPKRMLECPHCGREYQESNARHHPTYCLFNPHVEFRVQTFMRQKSVNGVALPRAQYGKLLKEYRLPALSFIQTYFPYWDDFCEWCGLEAPPTKKHASDRGKWKAIIRTVDAESAAARDAERDAFDWRKMPCIARGPRTYYDWRTRSYRTDEVMEMR